MIWILFLIIIAVAMFSLRIYCDNRPTRTYLQIMLPIAYIVATIIVFLVAVPMKFNMSIYNLYINPEDKIYYLLSFTVVLVLITRLSELYKKVKDIKKITYK